MGFRLDVYKKQNMFYGTKLYGYVGDETKLLSYQYLIDEQLIEKDKYYHFDYGMELELILKKGQLLKFLELYNIDYKTHFKENLLEDNEEFKNLYEKVKSDREYQDYILTWG